MNDSIYHLPSYPVTTEADGVGFSWVMMFRNSRMHSLLSNFHLDQNQNLWEQTFLVTQDAESTKPNHDPLIFHLTHDIFLGIK